MGDPVGRPRRSNVGGGGRRDAAAGGGDQGRSISADTRRLLVIARNRPSTLLAHAAARWERRLRCRSTSTSRPERSRTSPANPEPAWPSSTRPTRRRDALGGASPVVTPADRASCPIDGIAGDELDAFVAGSTRRSSCAQASAVLPNLLFTSGHHRPTEGGPAAAEDDRRRQPDLAGLRRAHRRPPARQARRRISSSARCTTTVR